MEVHELNIQTIYPDRFENFLKYVDKKDRLNDENLGYGTYDKDVVGVLDQSEFVSFAMDVVNQWTSYVSNAVQFCTAFCPFSYKEKEYAILEFSGQGTNYDLVTLEYAKGFWASFFQESAKENYRKAWGFNLDQLVGAWVKNKNGLMFAITSIGIDHICVGGDAKPIHVSELEEQGWEILPKSIIHLRGVE